MIMKERYEPGSWALQAAIFHVLHQVVLIPLYPVGTNRMHQFFFKQGKSFAFYIDIGGAEGCITFKQKESHHQSFNRNINNS